MALNTRNIIDRRYKLLRKLGSGGFSEVWLAENIQVGQINVALKIYYPESTTSAERARFIKKFALVFNLHHTNLLPYYDCNEVGGMLYFVMPWCERGSVAPQAGRMNEAEAWRFLSDVASGLACLHQKNIIHQDIKPDNVLVSNDNVYLITDFDISVTTKNTRRMGDEIPAGTAAYMAPERFGRQAAPIQASDVWALGASLYELLTGNFPFGDNGGLYQKSGAPIPVVKCHISRYLQSVIALCLQPEPWDRPTAKEITEFCNEFADTGKIAFSPKFRKIPGISERSKNFFSSKKLQEAAKKTGSTALVIIALAAAGTGVYFGAPAVVNYLYEQNDRQKQIKAERAEAEAQQRAAEDAHKKQKQINQLLSAAHAAFDRENPDYDKAFNLYMDAKRLGSTDMTGYTKFWQKAKALLNILGECDDIVRDLLLKAQQLSDTEEVMNELRKCK
jgi:serine/threonine protein kinase